MPKAPRPAPTKTSRTEPYPSRTMETARPSTASSALLPSTSASNVRGTTAWSPEDDQQLIRARASNMNWKVIASRYFPTKSDNACRKRHERLMEQQKKEDVNGVRLEALALTYMELRPEIWKPIADRLGEKWENVELKCMEKGLKTLQTTARSASRRHPDASPPHTPSNPNDENDHPDSGLGASGPPSSGDPSPQQPPPPSSHHHHHSSSSQHHQSSYQQQQQHHLPYISSSSATDNHHYHHHRHSYSASADPFPYRSGSCSSTSSLYQVPQVQNQQSLALQMPVKHLHAAHASQTLPSFALLESSVLQHSPISAAGY